MRFPRTLRARLVLITAIAITPVFGLVIYNYAGQRRLQADQVRAETLRLAQMLAGQQERMVQEARLLLRTLAELPIFRRTDLEMCNSTLQSIGRDFPMYTSIVLSASDGSSLCSSVPSATPTNSADRPWFQRVILEGSFVLGGYQIGRITGRPVLVAAYPIINGGEQVFRILAAALDIAWINQVAAQVRLPPGATLTLIDTDGTIVARHPDPEKWVGKALPHVPIIRTALAGGGEGTADTPGVDGVPRLYAFSPLAESPNRNYGYVLVGIPEDVAFSEVDRRFRRDLGGLSVLLVLSAVGTMAASRGLILRKSTAILRLAERLADGDMSARTGLPHGADEFGQLAGALDRMAAKSQERHEALVKAGEQLRQYADIVKNIQIGLLIYRLDDPTDDRSLRLIQINPVAEKLLGSARSGALNRTIDDLFPGVRERRIPKFFADVVRSGQACAIDEFEYGDQTVPASWWSFRGFPLPDSCVGVAFEDITQRKKTEEQSRALQSQLRQLQKMEAIGQLTGGIAHDFNNVLTGIIGNIQLALQQVGTDSPEGRDLLEALQLSNRCSGLIRQLLAFSRRQPSQPVVLNLNSIIDNCLKMLARLIGSPIALRFVPAADLGNMLVDPGQIEQVLVNLVINARDAMPSGGNLIVETANVILDQAYAMTHLEVKPGPYVMLAVTDTGHGMDEATKERIFEPFFTTKEPGRGTGFGLSTVYGIVKQHNGAIFVYSEIAKGTTFKIYLPQAEGKPEELGRLRARQEALPRGSETILLVEDQEILRTLIEKVLEAQGYAAMSAANADEAENLFAQNDTVSLLITDFIMPGRTGRQLYDALAAKRPGLKVLYISGYTDTSMIETGELEHGHDFLAKPFAPSTLVKKVREILDRTGN